MHSEKGKTLGKETRPVVIGSWSSREGLMTEAKHDGSFEAMEPLNTMTLMVDMWLYTLVIIHRPVHQKVYS